MNSITFLGTGGGRFVFLAQKRYSGGIWMELDGQRFIIDPGPGALVRALQFSKDPSRLDCVLSSHMHLDHYNDVEVMVEAMTHGLNRRQGTLVLQEGVSGYISDYHKGAARTIVSHPGDRIALNGIGVEVIPTANHAGGLGFSFDTSEGKVTYSGDTALDDATVGHYKGSHVLILNTLFPSGAKGETHLNTDDAIEIARIAKPKQLILTHFGVRMINVGPEKEASRVQEESGVHTIAAEDGMTILLSELGRLNSRK